MSDPTRREAKSFDVTVTERHDAVEVHVRGEIDIVTVPVLERHLDAALAAGRPSVVIDLSDTAFCDARGVAVLVRTRKRLAEAGGQLVLRRPPALVRRVLTLADQVDRLAIEE